MSLSLDPMGRAVELEAVDTRAERAEKSVNAAREIAENAGSGSQKTGAGSTHPAGPLLDLVNPDARRLMPQLFVCFIPVFMCILCSLRIRK